MTSGWMNLAFLQREMWSLRKWDFSLILSWLVNQPPANVPPQKYGPYFSGGTLGWVG